MTAQQPEPGWPGTDGRWYPPRLQEREPVMPPELPSAPDTSQDASPDEARTASATEPRNGAKAQIHYALWW
jgi:hypothetical protein